MENQESPQMSDYQKVAETVGMVPSLNVRDNVLQGIFVGLVTVLGFIFGYATGGSTQTALVYMLVGLMGSGLLSGVFLMILGMMRVASQQKKK